MLPQSHVAYTWLALSLAQDRFNVGRNVDYRLVALAAMASDLLDKPLAWAYFYRRYKSAVLFAHTLLAYAATLWITLRIRPQWQLYGWVICGHAILDRLWFFPNTFYWPLRGWRFHVWGKQGSEQTVIGKAYWFAFTRRPELWGWELGGLLALIWFVWRHQLYRGERLRQFVRTGKVVS